MFYQTSVGIFSILHHCRPPKKGLSSDAADKTGDKRKSESNEVTERKGEEAATSRSLAKAWTRDRNRNNASAPEDGWVMAGNSELEELGPEVLQLEDVEMEELRPEVLQLKDVEMEEAKAQPQPEQQPQSAREEEETQENCFQSCLFSGLDSPKIVTKKPMSLRDMLPSEMRPKMKCIERRHRTSELGISADRGKTEPEGHSHS